MDAVNVIPLDWFWKMALFIVVIFGFIALIYFFFLGKRVRHRFEEWRNGKNGKTEETGKCPDCGNDAPLCLGCGLCKTCCVMEIGRGINEKEN